MFERRRFLWENYVSLDYFWFLRFIFCVFILWRVSVCVVFRDFKMIGIRIIVDISVSGIWRLLAVKALPLITMTSRHLFFKSKERSAGECTSHGQSTIDFVLLATKSQMKETFKCFYFAPSLSVWQRQNSGRRLGCWIFMCFRFLCYECLWSWWICMRHMAVQQPVSVMWQF